MAEDKNFNNTGYGNYKHGTTGEYYTTNDGYKPQEGATVYRQNTNGTSERGTVDSYGNFKPY